MIFLVALYFVLATAALALLLLPQARGHALGWARQLVSSYESTGGVAPHRTRRGWLALMAMPLIAAPLVPLALRGSMRLDAYDQRSSRKTNEQVSSLLEGEQLVPPPRVPPELFTSAEIEQARPLIRGASRQWELLDADFKQRLLVVFKLMHDRHEYDLVLLEGYRSHERQAELAALGSRVTRARAFESYHEFGLAADVAFMHDGLIVLSERDVWAAKGYALYGAAARSVGLTWGGDWESLKDFGHVELRRTGVLGRPSS